MPCAFPAWSTEPEAGTRVVTDVVVLRARAEGEPARHTAGWDDAPVEVTSWVEQALTEPVQLSRYFVEKPEQVLGRVEVGYGLYGVELRVDGAGLDVHAALAVALARVAEGAGPTAVSAATEADQRSLLVAARGSGPSRWGGSTAAPPGVPPPRARRLGQPRPPWRCW